MTTALSLTRRSLLAAPLVSVAPGLKVAFGAEAKPANTLVSIFLRFGMDGLQLVAPAEDGNYRDKRRTIAVPTEGLVTGYPIGTFDGVPFFVYPRAGLLKKMFDEKRLAFVHAAGMQTASRSHFLDQNMIDKGMADREPDPLSGWLARHMTALGAGRGEYEAISNVRGLSPSLVGYQQALSFSDIEQFANGIDRAYADVIRGLTSGDGPVQQSMRHTLSAMDSVRARLASVPNVSAREAGYTFGALSDRLRPLARLMKLDLGVNVATIDFGGWDHHDYLVQSFDRQAEELARSLWAFFTDLGEAANRVTVVAFSEFGRRVSENGNGGTEHGAGGVMIVAGAGVNGGKIYGTWPGLADRDLDQGDLLVTTDYRRVLGELLVKRQGQLSIEQVFPTVPYRPLGIVS